jgi:hypothetical protein
MEVDRQTVPVIFEPAHAQVEPPVLSGHPLEAANQVVLGASSLAALHKHLGDTVLAQGDGLPPVRLRIVGTATLPTIGETLGAHPSMDTGAVAPVSVVPKPFLTEYGPFSGPNAIFVRLRPGAGAAGRASLQGIVDQLSSIARSPQVVKESNGGSLGILFELLPPQRPAEIVNYRAASAMPAALAGALAAGTVAALALTMVASVRRRRRDFALLKTLGFTRRQVALAVAWQATATGFFGVLFGVPVGVALGRWLWQLFAHQLSVVPEPTIPALWTAVVAAGALVAANVVAALPGRLAAFTPAALVLRAE